MKKYLLIIAILSNLQSFAQSNDNSNFGEWKTGGAELPFFELDFRKQECPWYPFPQFQGTGYNSILTNQWGDVNVFSTEYGLVNLTPSKWYSRGGFYPMIKVDGTLMSLIISELDSHKLVQYGVGYTQYSGEIDRGTVHLKVTYKIMAPFDDTKGFYASVSITNLSAKPLEGELSANSDLWIKPTYNNVGQWRELVKNCNATKGPGQVTLNGLDKNFHDISLLGNPGYHGSVSTVTLKLAKTIDLPPQGSESANFRFCYNVDIPEAKEKLKVYDVSAFEQTWAKALKPLQKIRKGNWMDRENAWDYAQLLSMCFYDKSLQEHFIHLGGYGIGNDPADPGNGFTMREVAETAIVLSHFNPGLAKSSLRWMAKTQLIGGDLKRSHDHYPLQKAPKNQQVNKGFPEESDTEIWFLMACGEYVKTTSDTAFLNETVPFRNVDTQGSMWRHMMAAYRFIKNDIGLGNNGLIKMLHGDWNDYLSRIGDKGHGQSVMNTAMMCKALIDLYKIAMERNDPASQEVRAYLEKLQQSVAACFDQGWFVRAYDDNGNPVGGHDDRLFINAQSWAALGRCGSAEQRKTALMNAVKLCGTPIGLTLISKPYSSPTPNNISWAPIPAGEGENAGIWPQTCAWMIWALSENGLLDEARAQWKESTLANHAQLYPNVPFGIYNGPDCYSSHYAHEREGWTQVEMFDRMKIGIPMNPIIAWQPFGMLQIGLHSNVAPKVK